VATGIPQHQGIDAGLGRDERRERCAQAHPDEADALAPAQLARARDRGADVGLPGGEAVGVEVAAGESPAPW
jgi:hypothetical protein